MRTGGRSVRSRKTRVGEVRSIDILDLQRNEVFSKGADLSWIMSWSRDDKIIASVAYRVEVDENGPIALRFMYSVTNEESGARKDYNEILPVVSTPCNYGGKRWWFICSLAVNGRPCQRRCRIIYLSAISGHFGCRECHQLSYESRQRHREKFYEGVTRPDNVIENSLRKLARTTSVRAREKIWRRILRAQADMKKFAEDYAKKQYRK